MALPYTCAMQPTPLEAEPAPPTRSLWLRWWRSLSPVRQDRFAALAPLAAVLMFLAAILTAFWYLRMEELDREQEALRRDVEYAQQRVRLRLTRRTFHTHRSTHHFCQGTHNRQAQPCATKLPCG